MFTELQKLLDTLSSVTLSLTPNTDGTITVTVIPKGGKEGNALDTPLTLTGTAAELDEGFASVLTSYQNKRQDLSSQLAATEAILDAAKTEAADKAKKSLAKPAKATSKAIEVVRDNDDDEEDGDETPTESSTPALASTTKPEQAAEQASSLWD